MPPDIDLSKQFILPDAPFLADLQGNILKGHGRDHTMNIFFRFNEGQESQARDWLAAFATHFVSSASAQLAETSRFKEQNIPGGLFFNVFLTRTCYDYLGLSSLSPTDPKFIVGMAGRIE